MACVGAVLLEARSFRPFRSSEEYLYAMKEDLAEWMTVLYPELRINADNFLDRLDTGVVLCTHANAVRESAKVILESAEESDDAITLAKALRSRPPVNMLPAAKAGTFFARDNLSNFIDWCRYALGILECLLFETDDLCLRKNEKHVVLCLLEVARKGSVLGMPAPLLVQMEKQIERELAGEELRPDDSALGLVPSGPQPQLVTNDLRSLDERVRDLVERCSCPTQFPMVRVSEGKYRIGDTKLLIFVRILRSHVMVRVGGGWDTLAHYLDKHDPCRCKAQHRSTLSARLARPKQSLVGATVTYERDPGPTSLPFTKNDKNDEPMSLQYPTKPYNDSTSRIYNSNMYSDAPTSLPYLGDVDRASSPSRKQLGPRTSPDRKSSSPDRRPKIVSSNHLVPTPHGNRNKSPRPVSPAPQAESASDNGSEVSDEGYRSLGVVAGSTQGSPSIKNTNRYSILSQNSMDDAEYNERLDQDDGCPIDKNERVDVYVSLTTGLRKTDFSDTFYGGKKTSSIDDKSNRGSPERIVTESNNSPSKNLRPSRDSTDLSTKTIKGRQASRIPHSPVRTRTPSRANTPSPKHAANPVQTSPKLAPKLPPSARNTWSGRTAPNQAKTKSRPTIGADTFDNPNKSPKTKTKVAPQNEAFKRNSPLRASSATLRSPPSNKTLSPLLEHILRSTETAKDDAAVLEKMKEIIRTYSKGEDSLSRTSSKDSDYADFTSAWVMSDGKLERSTSTRQLASPRKDPRNGASRIPAPVSIGCRRSTSTSQFQ
ncbi:GAS2-like protein pickled eggs [Galleria mellonella]|uniref:GAS2-like protein pickled eggs n=1 Tax=Galleria mellonella TaxID=7137 RepID=A0ABM3MJZ3_GALME|nr:GAS2-like protein pickled eggs [Galleria mellonella]XP_052751696.1 GAS2-like protein pickled eggs [Galleria mellonella]